MISWPSFCTGSLCPVTDRPWSKSTPRPFWPSVLQDCLRACQEQIEAALRESLREAAQTSSSPAPKAPRGSSSQGPSQTSTPTDVTAIHL
ncbi:G1/S-specific cyclin-D3 isoform X5 [Pongo pygmaeus]|uniref:G1/S-specific cyclin-D3 isoform X5 n=1 Tax=Pongo pygmaeus TaxID=9600 RepID=UPI0030045D55